MTTVVEILDRVARQCSVSAPSSWVSATDPTVLELTDFLDETVEDVIDRLDLVGPMAKSYSVAGDGSEDYDLPADFYRLQRNTYSVYEQTTTRRAAIPITDDGQWEYLQELGVTGAYRFYRLQGYEGNWSIGFQDVLDSGQTAIVSYVSDRWIINGSTEKADFTDAADVCLLPRRLIEAGTVMRFRRRKALFYQDVQATYEALIARYGNDSRTRRVIGFGATEMRSPFDIPVPDYIPPA